MVLLHEKNVSDLVGIDEPIISRKSAPRDISNNAVTLNRNLLNEISKNFPSKQSAKFSEHLNFSLDSERPIQQWFKYREGYSIDMVREHIKGLPKGSIILDPFCGCGTTLLAAQELGFKSIGFEINPMSALVSKVKTRNYTKKTIEQLSTNLKSIKKLHRNNKKAEKPKLNIIDKIFVDKVLDAHLIFKSFIESIEDTLIREFFLVGWLSILEDTSNVYKEGNGLKYRNRKRTPNGYVAIDEKEYLQNNFPDDKFDFVKQKLISQINLMISDIDINKKPQALIIEDSAENINNYIDKNSITYTIFSPPYCNCFNYFKIFKIELWMGGFVSSYKEMRALNSRGMRSHVETKLKKNSDTSIDYVDQYASIIGDCKLWDKRIPLAVKGYFIDMKNILEKIFAVSKHEGECAIVVGNSAYGGVIVPTDLLLAKIGKEEGFSVKDIVVARPLSTSSQQRSLIQDRKEYLRESIVYLTKDDPRLDMKVHKVVEEIPKDVSVQKNVAYLIKNRGLTKLTHKFHRYPGKFIPHVPRWAINKYLGNKNGRVLDPFCGSGTTLVEANLLGKNAIGIDIDPIAQLVSKVKTTKLNESLLLKICNQIKQDLLSCGEAEVPKNIENIEHWFTNDTALKLTRIRILIDAVEKLDKDIYDFLLVCFIAIIRKASKADNQSQKTYVSHTYPKKHIDPIELFLLTVEDYCSRIISFCREQSSSHVSTIILNANHLTSNNDSNILNTVGAVDLIVTSPPYVKSVDYVYNQMLEYYWLGDLFNTSRRSEQNELKKLYIGTEKVLASEYSKPIITGIKEIDTISNVIYSKNKKHGYIVGKYFSDLIDNFGSMCSILKKGGHYVSVVGDSIVSNEVVPVHKLIQLCGAKRGFRVKSVFAYEIRNRHMRFPRKGRGGLVKYDWIIDFEKE